VRRLDKTLLVVTLLLIAVGLTALYSAGQTDVATAVADVWKRQAVWMGLGVLAGALVFRISPRLLEWGTPFFYGGAIVLLVITLVVGVGAGTAAGSKSWISIAGVRVGQPAELAKIATILMLAKMLGERRHPPATIIEAIPLCLVAAVPFVLVGFQPDLGSAIVFISTLFAVLYWGGVKPSLLLLLASPIFSLVLAFSTLSWGIWIVFLTVFLIWVRPYVLEGVGVWLVNAVMGIGALGLWQQLQPYQQNRLLSFLNPETDPRATGWHIIQSKIAIGSGGIIGEGFTAGTQKRLAFLPAQHTDFVYSVVGEEAGFVGVVLTLGLFAALILAIIRIARNTSDPFSSLLVFGIAGLMATHVLVNVGMTIGIMPITGIPLPFFSYGGSFVLTCMMLIALALRIEWESRGTGYAGM
jgi:rod shape determining protein RodA